MTTRKNKPGQGRKPLGQDRGGLVPIPLQVFGDQAEWLRGKGNRSALIRIAIDEMREKLK